MLGKLTPVSSLVIGQYTVHCPHVRHSQMLFLAKASSIGRKVKSIINLRGEKVPRMDF